MSTFLGGLGTVLGLELRQRVRGVAWYVLLGTFALVVAGATLMLWLSISYANTGGGYLFSTIIFLVLLLGTLVAPALSGNAINGDRDAGALATTQVTLVSTGQLVLGKFLAAWTAALAFLVVALPFLIFSVALGAVAADTIVTAVIVLAIELGVVAALGVGLSGVIPRPLFSVVTTYLAVAALSIGTLIVFTLGGAATQSPMKTTYIGIDYEAGTDFGAGPQFDGPPPCLDPMITTSTQPRYDYYWGVLAANPYLVLADAAAGSFDRNGNPTDLFGAIASGVRSAQIPPDLDVTIDECAMYDAKGMGEYETPEQVYDRTVPTWFVGLASHVLLGAGALLWGTSRTRTPARKLPKGSRIA
ncbi:ABC transporter permease [Planctomonas psychrotolerans]|uniref:ABC transporter permease n=1 Tax=Planctomonas psychrotolerans TaxID=2528712 RepID=UPI00123C40C7|nr:ABC transporter permease [Planctomonas psychrotolerans]